MKMANPRAKGIDLDRFAAGTARLSPEFCGLAAAACASKLQEHGHGKPVELSVVGSLTKRVRVDWTEPDERTKGSLGEKATEFAGECIGILLCEKFTEFNVVERSWIGTGFDFWLGRKRDLLFQRKARLEVSALDHGTRGDVDARVRVKEEQIRKGTGSSAGAALIVVSEFKTPIARLERHA